MLTSSTPEGDVLLRRATTATSESVASTSSAENPKSSTCSPNSTSSFCERPVGTPTLPIALGVAIPVFISIVVLVILHRRHIRRLKKEDLIAAKIDLTQDDFDLTPPRQFPRGRREQAAHGTDYLLPISNFNFTQSNVSLNSPYDVVPKEASRMHQIQSYKVAPRAPESAMLRNAGHLQSDSHYDFQNHKSQGTPSMLSSVTSYAGRTLPNMQIQRPTTVKESFEMQDISKPHSDLAHSPSSDAMSSDPIVAAVYNGFKPIPDDAPSSSDLSSSPPGMSLSPPESLQSSSPTPFPKRSDSINRLSQRYPRPLSNTPPVPLRDSKIPPEDRVSYYEDQPASESGVDDDAESSSMESFHEVLEPAPAQSVKTTDTKQVQTSNLVPLHDEVSHKDILRRQRSFSSPADAEERANRLRSFYKDYFDNPMPTGHEPALPSVARDDSAVAYEFTGRVPTTAVTVSPGNSARGPHLWGPGMRHPMRAYDSLPDQMPRMPRAMSSQSARPYEQHVQYRHESQAYPAYNNGQHTPVYQPPHGPSRPRQRRQPKELPPLEPLSPLPTPHQLGEQTILGSPTLFAPPRRPRAGTAGSSMGSSGGSPTTPQQQWTDMQLRALPNPYMLRNSASYSGLEFLPPKKYSPGSVASVGSSNMDNAYQYGYNHHIVGDTLNRQLPRELVPVGRNGIEGNLRPQWRMRE
ncbi:hypothetical protein V1509DRAFT_378131 [Lipomyces kononenkoae]